MVISTYKTTCGASFHVYGRLRTRLFLVGHLRVNRRRSGGLGGAQFAHPEPYGKEFDLCPYIFLNLFLSMLASIQATNIWMPVGRAAGDSEEAAQAGQSCWRKNRSDYFCVQRLESVDRCGAIAIVLIAAYATPYWAASTIYFVVQIFGSPRPLSGMGAFASFLQFLSTISDAPTGFDYVTLVGKGTRST